MNREILLIVVAIISVYLFFKSMNRLSALYSAGKITDGKRIFLTYVSTLMPIVGFFIVYFYKSKLEKNHI